MSPKKIKRNVRNRVPKNLIKNLGELKSFLSDNYSDTSLLSFIPRVREYIIATTITDFIGTTITEEECRALTSKGEEIEWLGFTVFLNDTYIELLDPTPGLSNSTFIFFN